MPILAVVGDPVCPFIITGSPQYCGLISPQFWCFLREPGCEDSSHAVEPFQPSFDWWSTGARYFCCLSGLVGSDVSPELYYFHELKCQDALSNFRQEGSGRGQGSVRRPVARQRVYLLHGTVVLVWCQQWPKLKAWG